MRTPVFELHIKPMVRATDREHMLFALDLWDYDQVRSHADDILERVELDMPPLGTGGLWPQEWIDLFRRWMDSGFKRLELGAATYTFAQGATLNSVRATGTLPAAGYDAWLQIDTETDTAKTYVLYYEPPDSPVTGDPSPFSLRERYPATDTRAVFVRDSAGVQQLH